MIRHISALAALIALSLTSVACMAPSEEAAQDGTEETSQELAEGRVAQDPAAAQAETFVLFTGDDGKPHFRLVDATGEVLLTSQAYSSKASARDGIAAVKRYGATAARFAVFQADAGWSFEVVATNGQPVARGAAYASQAEVNRVVDRIAFILHENKLPTVE